MYNVFSNEEGIQDFNNLSEEELDRIAIVFEANLPKGAVLPVTPLSEKSYVYIWNVTVEEVETAPIPDEEVVTDNNDFMKALLEEEAKKMGDSTMGNKEKAKNVVNVTIENMKNAAKSAKVHVGDDKETFVNRCDKAINDVKNSMEPVLMFLDKTLGFNALKEEICGIMYDTLGNVKSKNGFFKMANKCRKAIEDKIEILSIIDPDDEFGKIASLKQLVGYNSITAEEEYVDQTIWMSFAKSLVWACKKAARCLRRWFGVDAENNILGVTGAAIAQTFAKVGNVIKNAAKIAGNFLLFVGSYAVAGTIALVNFVIKAVKFVAEKIKGWSAKAKQKITNSEAATVEAENEIIEEEITE